MGLPKGSKKLVIVVVVDQLSKYDYFCSLQHPFTPTSIAEIFLDHILKLQGMPTSIVYDHDPIFTSNFWQELFKLHETKLKMSTSYHPQNDDQTEVVSKCLETYLRCLA